MRISLLGLFLALFSLTSLVAQTLYGVSGTNLIRFSAADPCTVQITTAITGIAADQTISGLDFRPNTGQLYTIGYNDSTGVAQLYTINLTTGVATAVGAQINLQPGMGNISFDFNPTVDRIRVVGSNGANYRLNPVTGAIAATDTNLLFGTTDVNAADTAAIGAVAYTNSFPGSGTTTLYNYDLNLNILTTQNPPNAGTLNTVGSIGSLFTTTATSSDLDIFFDPATQTNVAYFIRNDSSSTGTTLYTVNLTTGAVTAVNTCPIGNGPAVQYIAIQTTGVVTSPITGYLVYAVTTNNSLITFDSDQPGQIQSIVPVTGITAGQMLCGLDFRPSTGVLYGIGYDTTSGQAQIYTINRTTGAATAVGSGTFNLGTGLGTIGFDFNPVADRIRVTGSNGGNFRLNPDTGVVAATDSPLTFATGDVNQSATAGVGAVAYTNSFSGTTTTTLYNIDQNLGILTTQNPPNNGTLNTVGTLGIPLDTVNRTFDLDIVYDQTTQMNVAFLVANTLGSNNDGLYMVNLTTGAAALVGSVGLGVQIKAIAIVADSVVNPPSAGIDLQLTASANPTNYNIYSNITYTITVANTGQDTAHNVVVDAGLVNGLVFTSSSVTQGTYNLFDENWSVGDLGPGDSATLTLVLFSLEVDSTVTNFFQVSSVDETGDPDSTPGNDTDQTPNEDDEALVTIFGPPPPPQGGDNADLELYVTLDSVNTTFTIYENVDLHLVLVNNGPDAADSITVSVPLPTGFVYAGDSTGTASGVYNLFFQRWDIPYLAAGDTARLDLSLFPLVSDTSTTIFFQVLTAGQDDPDSTPGNDTLQTADEDDEALLTILNTVQPLGGDSSDLELYATVDVTSYVVYQDVNFRLTLVNNGPDDAAGITVSAGLPQDFVFTSSNTANGMYNLFFQRWEIPFLAVGDTARLDLVLFPLSDSVTVSNFFQVLTSEQDDPDSTPGNDTDQTPNEDDEALATVAGQEQPPQGGVTADLSLFATTDSTNYSIYEVVTYHLVLVNSGPDAAAGVTVAAGLPQNFVFANDTTNSGQYNLFNQIWEVGYLQAGDTARLDLSLFSLAGGTNVNNFFEIMTSNQNDPDSTPGNGANSEDDQVTVTVIPGIMDNDPSEDRFNLQGTDAVATLYPVPAETFVNLRLADAQAQETAIIYIYDQLGGLVRMEKTAVLAGTNEWRFDISTLDAGMYFIALPGQMRVAKFIKM